MSKTTDTLSKASVDKFKKEFKQDLTVASVYSESTYNKQQISIFDKTSKKLVDDIAFFRDLENDFDHNIYTNRLQALEQEAYSLLVQNIELNGATGRVKTAVLGNFNAGKSSFINSLLGKQVCPVRVNPTTSSITNFIYSDKEKIIRIDTGKTISHDEYLNLCQHKTGSTKTTKTLEIEYQYPFNGFRNIELFDTPGFKNTENKYDEIISKNISEQADVILLVLDINIGEIDAELLSIIKDLQEKNQNIKFYLIANHADEKSPEACKKIIDFFREKYSSIFSDFFPYSAKEVLDNQIGSTDKILENIKSKLNSKIQAGTANFQISLSAIKKERLKPKYNIEIQEFSFNKDTKTDRIIKRNIQTEDNDYILENKTSVFIKEKNNILNLLKKIGDDKESYLRKSYDKSLNTYTKENKNKILKIKKELQNETIKKNNTSDLLIQYTKIRTIFVESYDKILKSSFLYDALLNTTKEAFKCETVLSSEKNFWRTPYARISFSRNKFYQLFSGDSFYWVKYKKIFKQYADSLIEFGFTNCLDSLNQDYLVIKQKFTNIITDAVFKVYWSDFIKRGRHKDGFYSNIEEAQYAYKNIECCITSLAVVNYEFTITNFYKFGIREIVARNSYENFNIREKLTRNSYYNLIKFLPERYAHDYKTIYDILCKPRIDYGKKYHDNILSHFGKFGERNEANEKNKAKIIIKIDAFIKK